MYASDTISAVTTDPVDLAVFGELPVPPLRHRRPRRQHLRLELSPGCSRRDPFDRDRPTSRRQPSVMVHSGLRGSCELLRNIDTAPSAHPYTGSSTSTSSVVPTTSEPPRSSSDDSPRPSRSGATKTHGFLDQENALRTWDLWSTGRRQPEGQARQQDLPADG